MFLRRNTVAFVLLLFLQEVQFFPCDRPVEDLSQGVCERMANEFVLAHASKNFKVECADNFQRMTFFKVLFAKHKLDRQFSKEESYQDLRIVFLTSLIQFFKENAYKPIEGQEDDFWLIADSSSNELAIKRFYNIVAQAIANPEYKDERDRLFELFDAISDYAGSAFSLEGSIVGVIGESTNLPTDAFFEPLPRRGYPLMDHSGLQSTQKSYLRLNPAIFVAAIAFIATSIGGIAFFFSSKKRRQAKGKIQRKGSLRA